MKRLFALLIALAMLSAAAFPAGAEPADGTRDAVGMSLIGLNTRDLYGNTVTDSIFGGYTMTVMNYWATWCSPCIGEMPDFLTLYNHYQATPENDVDGNGSVDSADALLTFRYVMGLADAAALDLIAADVEGDGTVTSADALLIMRRVMGLEAL